MVIRETQRTYTYLNLYDYATDAILVNRVFPDEITDPFFDVWKQRQAENLEFVSEAFGSLPVLQAPLFGEEMGGLDMLRRLADELYGDRNPAERMFDASCTSWNNLMAIRPGCCACRWVLRKRNNWSSTAPATS